MLVLHYLLVWGGIIVVDFGGNPFPLWVVSLLLFIMDLGNCAILDEEKYSNDD